MVQFNFSERTIKAKVVYYGPAQSGKTTNLEQIHRITDPSGNNRLISLNTAQDRTLFFDLLPFSLGSVSGYDFKVQLYTVPGQVQHNQIRRVVLAGADAVVFVADSRKALAKENVVAFENMKVNLLANRLVPEKVPLVVQFNKQDLPDLQSLDELNRTLNLWHRPAFPAVAMRGEGVLETFVAVVTDMLANIAAKYNLKEKGLDPAAIPEFVSAAFSSLMKQAADTAPPPGESAPRPAARIVLAQSKESDQAALTQAGGDGTLVSEEMLQRSLRTNLELAEALAGLVRDMSQGLGAIQSHAELLMVYREEAREKRQAAVLAIQAEAARLRRIMQELGAAGDAARTAPRGRPTAGARPAPAPSPAPAPAPAQAAAAPEATVLRPSTGVPTVETALREALVRVRGVLDARRIVIDLGASTPAPLPPRLPAAALGDALATLLTGLCELCPPGSAVRLRVERKPVLLRNRDGQEEKRDFFMLALAHPGVLSAEQQQRALQGTDADPIAAACRAVKGLRGFVRFAPLSGGGLETRLFLPAT